MTARVDGGPVVAQARVPIRDDDTVHTLVRRTKVEVGGPLLVRALARIEAGAVGAAPVAAGAGRVFSYPDAAAVARFRARGRRFV
jgi:methionyl-tRNA formyltransferase